MEFDGDDRMLVTSKYDQYFLNEVFIGWNLNSFTDKKKYGKVKLLGLIRVQ